MSGSSASLERASALHDLGRHTDALQLLTAHVAGKPTDGAALLLMAWCHLALGHQGDALAAADAAVAAEPDDEAPHRARALALVALGLHTEARAAAETAVRLEPHDWRTHYTYAQSLVFGADAMPGKACVSAEQAIRLAPYESSPHVVAGLAWGALNHLDKAEQHFREALQLDPADSYAVSNLSALMVRRGRFVPAAEHVGIGLAASPHAAHLHHMYVAVVARLARRFGWLLLVMALVIGWTLEDGLAQPLRGLLALIPVGCFAVAISRVSRRLPGDAQSQRSEIWRRADIGQRLALAFGFLAALLLLALGLLPQSEAVWLWARLADVFIAARWIWVALLLLAIAAGWARLLWGGLRKVWRGR